MKSSVAEMTPLQRDIIKRLSNAILEIEQLTYALPIADMRHAYAKMMTLREYGTFVMASMRAKYGPMYQGDIDAD